MPMRWQRLALGQSEQGGVVYWGTDDEMNPRLGKYGVINSQGIWHRANLA
jgi:hypothetical protein